jgi:hypothetical protein
VEEKLFSQALTLLLSSLQSGLDTQAPACLPPPAFFDTFSTLVVHPTYNTRTNNTDKQNESNVALQYLRSVVESNAGGATLNSAFRFDGPTRSDRSKRAKSRQSAVVDAGGVSNLDSLYAGLQSVWNKAQDFWAVVGWAFNCSVQHKARWSRWSLWLELMIEILDKDLTRAAAGESKEIADCLLAHYLAPIGEGRNNRRRVMRAITADGTMKSMAEFGEIWKDETSPPKKQEDDRAPKRQKLDLEKGQYGDYFDDESEVEDSLTNNTGAATASTTRRKRRGPSAAQSETKDGDDRRTSSTSEDSSSAAGLEAFGGIESLKLRQRLLLLLARFSVIAPRLFVETEDLFDLYVEFFRPLPLDIFQQFVSPQTPYFAPDMQALFNEILFRPLLGSSTSTGVITQQIFEEEFAPNAAVNTSVEDNAKVSLLTESLLRALWSSNALSDDLSRLGGLVEDGIMARTEKVSGRKSSAKNGESDAHARRMLDCSSERLRLLVGIAASG